MPTDVKRFTIELNTKGDDKDKGEGVQFEVHKGDKIVYKSNFIGKENTYHNDTKVFWQVPDGDGKKIEFPFTVEDSPDMKLRVEKEGDDGWIVSFRVIANGNIILLNDTPPVQFGKRNPIEVNNILNGADGTKFVHTDGGSYHIFGFTAK